MAPDVASRQSSHLLLLVCGIMKDLGCHERAENCLDSGSGDKASMARAVHLPLLCHLVLGTEETDMTRGF